MSSSQVTTVDPPFTGFISKPPTFEHARLRLGYPAVLNFSGVAASEAVVSAAAEDNTTESPALRAASTAQNPPTASTTGTVTNQAPDVGIWVHVSHSVIRRTQVCNNLSGERHDAALIVRTVRTG